MSWWVEFRRVLFRSRLQSIDVLGIDLRAEVAGDVRVRDGNTVDQPAHLMAAADVQLIVREIGAGDIVGDYREAVRTRGAGRFLNLQAVYERRRAGGFCLSTAQR